MKYLKNICIILLFVLMIILTFISLQTINKFMKSYDNCKDDFMVIEVCKFLPSQGNYSYFNYTRNKYAFDVKTEINTDYVMNEILKQKNDKLD